MTLNKSQDNSREWFAFWLYFVSYLWLGPILISALHLWLQKMVTSDLSAVSFPLGFTSINLVISPLVIGNFILYSCLSLVFLCLFSRDFYRDFYHFRNNLWLMFKGIIFGSGIIVFFSICGSLLLLSTQQQSIFPENQQIINQMLAQHFFITSFFTIFFAPFVEESIFRLVFFRIGQSFALQPWLLIMFSTLSYASIHLIAHEQLIDIVPYLLIGFALALTYQRYQNFWICFLIHSLNNIFALLLSIFFQFLN